MSLRRLALLFAIAASIGLGLGLLSQVDGITEVLIYAAAGAAVAMLVVLGLPFAHAMSWASPRRFEIHVRVRGVEVSPDVPAIDLSAEGWLTTEHDTSPSRNGSGSSGATAPAA